METNTLKNQLWLFYAVNFPALFFFLFIFLVTTVDTFTAVYFFTGYVWMMTFATPGMRAKVDDSRYRFSFLRFLFNIYDFLLSFCPSSGPRLMAAKFLLPLFFCLVIRFLSHGGSIVYCLLGSIIFELLNSFVREYRLSKTLYKP